jgi:hypothetical protein
MGGAYSMYGKARGAYRVLVGKPEGNRTLEDPGIDGRVILKWIIKRCSGGVDWIDDSL